MHKTRQASFLVGCLGLALACSTPGPPRPRVTVSPLFSPEVYDRIAVYVEERVRGRLSEGALRAVEDEFMRAALARGYTLVARSDLEKVLEEIQRQGSPVTEQALARAGKVLNASAVLLVSVNDVSTERYRPILAEQGRRYYKGTASMSARLISADLGQVVWIGSYTGTANVSNYNRGDEALPLVAAVVASGLPSK